MNVANVYPAVWVLASATTCCSGVVEWVQSLHRAANIESRRHDIFHLVPGAASGNSFRTSKRAMEAFPSGK